MSKHQDEWNRNVDKAIEALLKKHGISTPTNDEIDPRYKTMTTEEIYADLQRLHDEGSK